MNIQWDKKLVYNLKISTKIYISLFLVLHWCFAISCTLVLHCKQHKELACTHTGENELCVYSSKELSKLSCDKWFLPSSFLNHVSLVANTFNRTLNHWSYQEIWMILLQPENVTEKKKTSTFNSKYSEPCSSFHIPCFFHILSCYSTKPQSI